LWHFTDEFYHTDGDRLDKVSTRTLANVGTAALVSALTLASADGPTARAIVAEVEGAAMARLEAESALSRASVRSGATDWPHEEHILRAWGKYYEGALAAASEIEVGGASAATAAAIQAAVGRVHAATERIAQRP
jgi:hypothetical protein